MISSVRVQCVDKTQKFALSPGRGAVPSYTRLRPATSGILGLVSAVSRKLFVRLSIQLLSDSVSGVRNRVLDQMRSTPTVLLSIAVLLVVLLVLVVLSVLLILLVAPLVLLALLVACVRTCCCRSHKTADGHPHPVHAHPTGQHPSHTNHGQRTAQESQTQNGHAYA